MRARTGALCLLMLGVSNVLIGGAPQSKVPWDWTIEDRLAARFDPDKNRERQLAYEAKYPQAAGANAQNVAAEGVEMPARQQHVHMIDGSRNPELFFAYELFDGLMSGLTPDESQRVRQRAYFRPSIRALGYDDEAFWRSLESVSAKYLPLCFPTTHPIRSAEVKAAAEARCRERYDALEAARALFGRRRFDVLLYTVVAPVSQYSSATFDANPAARYREAEKGCR